MGKILDFIAEETGGRPYKSQRFCYDAEVKLPSLSYDDNQEFTVRKDKNGETDTSLKTYKNLTEAAKIFQKEKPLFKYFLDGSRRVYKVDDIEYSRRLFPVVGGQIGVACCQRNASDSFGKAIFENHLVLSLPSFAKLGQHPTQFLGRLTKQINENERLKRLNVKFDEINGKRNKIGEIKDILFFKAKDRKGDFYIGGGIAFRVFKTDNWKK